VGASGDLAPLAHLSLVLLGKGEAFYDGRRMSGEEALKASGLAPIRLESAEGLALVNGTQVMTAIGALSVHDARQLSRLTDIAASMTLEVLMGSRTEFNPKIHQVRPHPGQIAAAAGDSRWITGEAARRRVHRMRSEADAVLVGGETARRDDPLLTARVPGGRNPRRVILTSRPAELLRGKVLRESGGEVIVACPKGVPQRDVRLVRDAGGRVLRLPARGGAVRARDFLAALGAEGVTSLLVEGGARTAGWLASEGAIDRYVVFVAPLLLGEGIRAVSGWASRSPTSGTRLAFTSVRRVGTDVEITAEPMPASASARPKKVK